MRPGARPGSTAQELAQNSNDEIIAEMEAQGVEVIRPDLAPFRDKATAVYGQFPEWSDGLYEEIKALVDAQG